MSILFSPGTVDPAELDARTVGRRGLIDRLTDRLVAAARDGSRPHTLLLGPRGSGKTLQLDRLRSKIRETLAAERER